jgi:uncharacterized membrane protein YccF (DUF307 family)
MGMSQEKQGSVSFERRAERIASSPEQLYEKGLRPQQRDGQTPPPQQSGQPPMIVQNFYQMPPQPVQMPTPLMVNVGSSTPNIFLRVLWFICIGWWLGLIWLHIGYTLCVTGIFLPVGLVMLNHLPEVLTLRSSHQQTTITLYNNGIVALRTGGPQQVDFLVRAVYFLCIGWWFGYLWALLGYVFCCTIFFIPFGVMMLNRLPAVLTLRQM